MITKVVIDSLIMRAARGFVTPTPQSEEDLIEVLKTLPDMTGIVLQDTPDDIIKRTKTISDAQITYFVLNTLDGDICISFILDCEEFPAKTAEDLLRTGYVLAYVYNVTYPYCSEPGDIFLECDAKGAIHRVG